MINVKGLNKYYNKKQSNEIHVINDINLNLPNKGLIAFFGKSGCGKTTLLNVLGGLDNFDKGSIYIDNELLTSKNRDYIRNKNIGYIFQNYCLDSNYSVLETIENALIIAGAKKSDNLKERALLALKCVGMDKYQNRNVVDLSGGQQQRVAIARAIVKGPKIILADEPTGNLDEENTILIMDILKELSKDKLVLLVSHEQDIVEQYADEIIQIVDGEIESDIINDSLDNLSIKQSKNIYLEDYTKSSFEHNGIKIDYYGDIYSKATSIIIVANNGKLYLKSNDKNLNIINDRSEVQIYNHKEKQETKKNSYHIEQFDSIDSKKNGKLYSFKKAFKDGLKMTFGKKKKGQKSLRILFSLLAIVVVFLSAKIGGSYYCQNKLNYIVNGNALYLQGATYEDYLSIYEKKYGEAFFIRSSSNASFEEYMIYPSGFETDSIMSISVNSFSFPMSVMGDKQIVHGHKADKKNEVYISTAMADEVIKNSKYSFINSYESIIGMNIKKSTGNGILDAALDYVPLEIFDNYDYFSIAGIYNSSESEVCFHDAFFQNGVYYASDDNLYSISVCSEGRCNLDLNLQKGQAVLIYYEGYTGDKTQVKIRSYYDNDVFATYDIVQTIKYEGYGDSCLIVNEEDYKKYFFYDTKYSYYDRIAVIYEGDATKRASIYNEIKSSYSSINLMSKQEYVDYEKDLNSEDNTVYVVMVAIILFIIALVIFFVMRTNLFNKIKEIGISRAIGVNKSNIMFRFFVESLALVTTIVFIVHFVISAIFWKLMTISTAIYSTFYYPAALYFVSLAILFAVISIAAILPSAMLLRKTPAQLLSKYDI